MNYIILEGLGLWLALGLIFILMVIALTSFIYTVLADKRIFTLESLLYRENEKVKCLMKKNFILHLKNGEIDIDE